MQGVCTDSIYPGSHIINSASLVRMLTQTIEELQKRNNTIKVTSTKKSEKGQ